MAGAHEEEQKGFYVEPKTDCPHLQDHVILAEDIEALCNVHQSCEECGHSGENWVSLEEHRVFCSRYQQGHMLSHYEANKNNSRDGCFGCIVMSFADLSFWCYECSDYITHPVLKLFHDAAHKSKFGEERTTDRRDRGSNLGVNPDEDVHEIFEDGAELERKIAELAVKVREADKVVVYTGAGISTSAGIPDYRGPTGVWTARAKGLPAPRGSSYATYPTFAHMAVKQLVEDGKVSCVVSQNTDGMHLRSGIPLDQLAELHGNTNLEICTRCRKPHMRDFHTRTAQGVNSHETGRSCTSCRGPLADTIVNFGENLPEGELTKADNASRQADLALVLGTSLRVSPANLLPRLAKDLVICNLQPTPVDKYASMLIHARTDDIMRRLCRVLHTRVKEHVEKRSLEVGVRNSGKELFVAATSGFTQLTFHRQIKTVVLDLPTGRAEALEEFPFAIPLREEEQALKGGFDLELHFANAEEVPPLRVHMEEPSAEELAAGDWSRPLDIFYKPRLHEWGCDRDHSEPDWLPNEEGEEQE